MNITTPAIYSDRNGNEWISYGDGIIYRRYENGRVSETPASMRIEHYLRENTLIFTRLVEYIIEEEPV